MSENTDKRALTRKPIAAADQTQVADELPSVRKRQKGQRVAPARKRRPGQKKSSKIGYKSSLFTCQLCLHHIFLLASLSILVIAGWFFVFYLVPTFSSGLTTLALTATGTTLEVLAIVKLIIPEAKELYEECQYLLARFRRW